MLLPRPTEPCPPGSAQGHLHAKVNLLEFSVPSPPPQGYRPWIGCRERAIEARTLISISSKLRYSCSSGEGAGHPGRIYFVDLSALPTGPTIEYVCKLEIQLWLGISKMTFRMFVVHTRRRPGGQGQGRSDFCFLIFSCKFRTHFLFYDFECKSH